MADKIKITRQNIFEYYQGYDHFFPEGSPPNDTPYLKWSSLQAFTKEIAELTGIDIKSGNKKAINDSQQALEGLIRNEVEANTVQKEQLENLGEKAEIAEAQRKETIAKAKKEIQDSLERQQKAKNLKNLYAKVEVTKKETRAEANKAIEDLKTKYQGSEHQHEMAKDVAKLIEEKVAPSLSKDLSKEEIRVMSAKAAADWVGAINNPDTAAAYQEAAIQDSILIAAANDPNASEITRQAAADLFVARRTGIEINRQLIEAGLGEGFGDVFGSRMSDVKVSLYINPNVQATHALYAEQLNSGYGGYLKDQLSFVDSVGNMPLNEAKSYLFEQLGRAVDVRIAALPTDSLVRGLYQNDNLRNVVSLAAGKPITLALSSESWLGGMAISSPGGLKTANAIGGIFGVNFSTGGKAASTLATGIGEVGKDVAVKAAGSAIVKGTQVAIGTGATGGIAAAATAFFVWTGPLAPVLGAATAFLANIIGGEVLKNIVSKASIFISKHKEDFFAIVGLAAGFTFFRTIPGAIGGGLFAYFAARGILRGLGGPARSLTVFGSAIGLLAAKGLFQSIIKPLIYITVVIPLVVAFILFIINSGAYVVPPSISSLSSQNAYIDVTKTANPPGPFENTDLPLKITYTITITAKKDNLTNVVIKDECKVITKAGSQPCTAPSHIVPGGDINTGSPYTFSYEANYNSSYKDALVIDTVTVSANTLTSGSQETGGSESIIIGKPPTECLELDKNWDRFPSYKSNIQGAISILASEYNSYLALVCSGYVNEKLVLKYNPIPNDSYWGFNHTSYVDFYTLGVGNPNDALYTLAHELGHSLVRKVSGIGSSYIAFPGITSEAPTCFYNYGGDADERLPEAIAFYVIPVRACSLTGKDSDISNWPKHNAFLKQLIFK